MKKHITRIMAAILAFVVILTCFTGSIWAAESNGYTVTAYGRLEFKDYPADYASSYMVIPENIPIYIDGVNNDGWGHTIYNGMSGWVYLRNTKISGDFTSEKPSWGTPVQDNYMVFNTDGEGLELRVAPTPYCSTFGPVYDGTVVTVYSLQGEWAYAYANGHYGWLHRNFLAWTDRPATVYEPVEENGFADVNTIQQQTQNAVNIEADPGELKTNIDGVINYYVYSHDYVAGGQLSAMLKEYFEKLLSNAFVSYDCNNIDDQVKALDYEACYFGSFLLQPFVVQGIDINISNMERKVSEDLLRRGSVNTFNTTDEAYDIFKEKWMNDITVRYEPGVFVDGLHDAHVDYTHTVNFLDMKYTGEGKCEIVFEDYASFNTHGGSPLQMDCLNAYMEYKKAVVELREYNGATYVSLFSLKTISKEDLPGILGDSGSNAGVNDEVKAAELFLSFLRENRMEIIPVQDKNNQVAFYDVNGDGIEDMFYNSSNHMMGMSYVQELSLVLYENGELKTRSLGSSALNGKEYVFSVGGSNELYVSAYWQNWSGLAAKSESVCRLSEYDSESSALNISWEDSQLGRGVTDLGNTDRILSVYANLKEVVISLNGGDSEFTLLSGYTMPANTRAVTYEEALWYLLGKIN